MAGQNMPDQNGDRKLDEMLDSTLSAYSAAEPRPGLETRILANLKEQSAQRARPWNIAWMWTGAAVTAVAVILLAIHFSRPPKVKAPQSAQQEAPVPVQQVRPRAAPEIAAANPADRQRGKKPVPARSAAVHEVAEVRQDVFPSPTALSDQEKLLLSYIARTPREELVAQSHPERPAEDEDGNDVKDGNPNNLTQVPQRSSNTR